MDVPLRFRAVNSFGDQDFVWTCIFLMCLQSWLTNQLLRSLVERRRMVKSWLKTASGLQRQQFDIQQQALKLTANR